MAKRQMPDTTQSHDDTVGLLACGSRGAWEIAVDEALSGAERWWLQIEGPALYLRFEIASLNIVNKIVRFLSPRSTKTNRSSSGSPKRSGSLVLGGSNLSPVTLVKDDEYDDRFFFVIGSVDDLTARFVIAGTDISDLVGALQQAEDDLSDGTKSK